MPEIQITDDQADRLRSVQQSLREEVVGKYGHVRPRDAIEYLLDRYERDAVETDDAAGADGDTGVETEADADGGATARIVGERDAGEQEAADDGEADADATPDAAESGLVGRGAATARIVTDDEEADATDGDDESSGRLDSMMNLANEHDDKWHESTGGEERYVVELPDGTTEPARTKDDVRALLFKHYR